MHQMKTRTEKRKTEKMGTLITQVMVIRSLLTQFFVIPHNEKRP